VVGEGWHREVSPYPDPEEFWWFISPFAVGMLILEELRKWLVRRTLRHSAKLGQFRTAS
jgi:hypothetical protein